MTGDLGEDDRDVDVEMLDEDEIEGGRTDMSLGEEILVREEEEGVHLWPVSDCDLILLIEGEKECPEWDREWKIVGEKGSTAYKLVLSLVGKRPNDLPVLSIERERDKDDEAMVRPVKWDEIGDELVQWLRAWMGVLGRR